MGVPCWTFWEIFVLNSVPVAVYTGCHHTCERFFSAWVEMESQLSFGLYFPGMLIYFYLIHWSFIFLNLKSVCSIYLPIYWLNWFCFGGFFLIYIYPGIDPLQDKYLVLKIVLFVVLLCTFWFVYISWNWSFVRWVSSKEFFFIMWTVSLLSVDDFLCWVGLFYYFSVSVLFYFNFFLDLLSLS